MTSRRSKAIGVWIGIAAVFVAVVALALFELRTQGTTAIGGFTVANYKARAETQNRPAPDFEEPSLEGGADISMSSFRGDVVVLNFWASWCGPCRREAPGLRALSQEYWERGVRFLGVDYRDDRAAARAFVDEFRIPYPSVVDPSGSIAFRYDLLGLPTTFVVDSSGTIRYRFVGYLQRDVLQAALDDVLSNGSS
jgi:DsbE subfamily thiol:disulfide oxidoreductase